MRFPPDSSSVFFFIMAMQYLSTIKYGEGIKITIVQNLESKAMLAHCNLYVDRLHYQKIEFSSQSIEISGVFYTNSFTTVRTRTKMWFQTRSNYCNKVRVCITIFGWDENNILTLKHLVLFSTWSADGMNDLLCEDQDQIQEFDIFLNI